MTCYQLSIEWTNAPANCVYKERLEKHIKDDLVAAAGSVYRLKQLYDEAAELGPVSPFNRMLSNVHLGNWHDILPSEIKKARFKFHFMEVEF